MSASTSKPPTTIDEYLAPLSDDKRAALERLRKIIRAAAPKAEECISYQLPAFRLDGKCFIWLGAAANHCAVYGVGGADADELEGYDTSKGTIRFQPDKPLPAALVRKLVKARIAKERRQAEAASGRRRAPPLMPRPTPAMIGTGKDLKSKRAPQTVSKSRFKAQALEYLREVEKSGKELVITDHGRPVLKVVPYAEDPASALESLRGSVLRYDDPLEPIGEDWEASR